jgi:acid phosphatase
VKKIGMFFVGTMMISCVFAKEPNLGLLKVKLTRYHDSGRYMQELARVDKNAMNYLKKRVSENLNLSHPKKLAVVFDIDETVLSNWEHIKANDFGGNQATWDKLEEAGDDTALKPALKLYQLAKKEHVTVFFVTGRRERHRVVTVRNLKAAGFSGWEKLYLKPNTYAEKSVVAFKAYARKKIEAQGYDVIFTMGDQNSDLDGGYADRKFKLPNPFYYIP